MCVVASKWWALFAYGDTSLSISAALCLTSSSSSAISFVPYLIAPFPLWNQNAQGAQSQAGFCLTPPRCGQNMVFARLKFLPGTSARNGKEIAMESTVHSLIEAPMAASITSFDIVRSWKDPRYRRNLSDQQLQTLPEHPAGAAMLTVRELKAASGLIDSEDDFGVLTTSFDCTSPTFLNSRMCGCK
jgi:mersacidin/lichenicidin family type 2 lantibiotic